MSKFQVFIESVSKSGFVIDMCGEKPETQLIVYKKKTRGINNQLWSLETRARLECANVNGSLRFAGFPTNEECTVAFRSCHTTTAFVMRDGNEDGLNTHVSVRSKIPGEAAQWIINYEGNSAYTIRAATNFDMCITDVDGRLVIQPASEKLANQMWKFDPK